MSSVEPSRIALAQMNPIIGDLDGNATRIVEWANAAAAAGARVVVFPELALSGYAARDLFCRGDFLAAAGRTLESAAARIGEITVLVGYPERFPGREDPPFAASSVAMLRDGAIRASWRKRVLEPGDGAGREGVFLPGEGPGVFTTGQLTVEAGLGNEYGDRTPAAGTGLLAISAGLPYVRGAARAREEELRRLARRHSVWVALADQAGGQDELVFPGGSALVSPDGEVVARARPFEPGLLLPDSATPVSDWPGETAELYAALVAGIRDYARNNGFERIGVGLSGGIDSALVAALGADAVGAGSLSTVVMSSPHSSEATQADARAMARGLGCELLELPISEPMSSYDHLLGADAKGLAAENLQARIRGNLLMALSNSRGWLVLATGNRSEAAVGYATLYGDMAGGLAPLLNVPKTTVFELCRYRNGISPVIPQSIIDRPPSAELAPDQRDSDSLPEYPELDRLLHLYLDRRAGLEEMVRAGEDPEVAARVIRMVDRAEYKRRQAAPGLRLSPTGFSPDRWLPLTGRFTPAADSRGTEDR